jgi:hypothetical protein
MKTAIKSLINDLKEFKKFPKVDQITIDSAIEFAELSLEKEKQQIIDCHIEGQKSMNFGMNSFKHLAEDYYNKNFK